MNNYIHIIGNENQYLAASNNTIKVTPNSNLYEHIDTSKNIKRLSLQISLKHLLIFIVY